MNLKLVSFALQVLAVLPLLTYPAVLVANAMQAAALMDKSQRNESSRGQRALMGIFVTGTIAYPLVSIVCRVLAGRAQTRLDETRELAWSAAPLLFIGNLAALLAFLMRNE